MLRPLLFALLLAATLLPLPAEEASPVVSARTTEGDLSRDGAVSWTGLEFRSEGLLITADHGRYERSSATLTATGHVVLTRGPLRLLADRLTFRRADGRFAAENIRLGHPPYFVEGRSAEGSREEITVLDARVSYGEPGPWRPSVSASRIVFSPGRSFRAENSATGIGRTRLLALPRLDHDLTAPLPVSLSFDGGFRRSLGAYAEFGALLPVARGLQAGADLSLYTRRGIMAGPAARYSSPADPARLQGSLRSGFIDDHGDKKHDLLGRPVPEERAFVEWRHQQKLSDTLSLNAQLNWWRDSEVLRDFRPRDFFPVQEPDTFVEAVHTGANHFLSAFARFQPNSFHRVQERLPEISFDLLPSPIGGGFLHRLHAGAAVLREDPVPDAPPLRGNRIDAYYAVTRPIAPVDWFAFTPVAGGRFTQYLRPETSGRRADDHRRLLGELGFDAIVRTSGTFDYRNPRWKIDGLRHLLTPRLSYRYIPRASRGRAAIPPIDRETFATYLPTLGLGDIRHLDDLRDTQTLRLGLDNLLQTRDATAGSRDLLALNLASDFRLSRRRGERDVSEIHAEAVLTPASWLQFDLYQSFSPQDFTLREFNSGLTLRDGSAWSLRFANNFLRRHLQDYLLDGRLRLNERFEAVARLHYDARRRRFVEQTYGIAHNLANAWLITYSISVYSGRRRESNFGLDVRVDAIRF